MIYLQYLASFIISLGIFYIFFKISKIIITFFDKRNYERIFLEQQKILERDRIDEEKGIEERRRLRRKENIKKK
jgi:hypothetical protein